MNKSIGFNYKYNSAYEDRINLIEQAGFSGVFIYSQYNPSEYIEIICDSSLRIDSLHLPYKKFEQGKCVDSRYVNVLWTDETVADLYVKELIDEVKFAHEYKIDTVVMHITGGDIPPDMSDHGIINIEKVLNACELYDITLCLENLRRLDYLSYVFNKLDSKHLKFCFDSGHANVMTKNIDNFPWGEFGDKLFYLHLNDNNGAKDQHLIPFNGNINWYDLMKTIFAFNNNIGLTLEVRSSEEIRNAFSENQYLELCFNSLSKLDGIFLRGRECL